MAERVLITGGAGFIGSHLADRLLAAGKTVRVLDDLTPQVHGPERRRPAYLDPEIELQVGDVRDAGAVRRALDGVDVVVHFAARVGVGQSMYEAAEFTSVNNFGTSVLLEALAARPVRRLLVASSMSVYGEGRYVDGDGQEVVGAERSAAQLREGDWTPRGADGDPLRPKPTPENKTPSLASVYALSKFDQERLCLLMGRAYRVPTVALRFFNVYGPRQALSNPYTGVLAIFASRLMNGRSPLVFEDGRQRRDFVHVRDVAEACGLALESERAEGRVLNVGSGESFEVGEIAVKLARLLGRPELGPEISGTHRVGDIRHCFAEVGEARRVLGYRPRISLDDGLAELGGWLAGREAKDRVDEMRAELSRRGLTI
jgi:dTDP-L-rhamnose 4-epimerase